MAQINYSKNDFQPVTLMLNSADELEYLTEILFQPSDHSFRKRNLKNFDADIDVELYGLLAEACLNRKNNYNHHEEEHSLPIILDIDHEDNRYDKPKDRTAREQDIKPSNTFRLGNEIYSDCTHCTQEASFSES